MQYGCTHHTCAVQCAAAALHPLPRSSVHMNAHPITAKECTPPSQILSWKLPRRIWGANTQAWPVWDTIAAGECLIKQCFLIAFSNSCAMRINRLCRQARTRFLFRRQGSAKSSDRMQSLQTSMLHSHCPTAGWNSSGSSSAAAERSSSCGNAAPRQTTSSLH